MRNLVKKSIKSFLHKMGFMLVRERYNDNRHLKAFSIPGFFSNIESRALYILSVITDGPILEIGHFLGKSTACICEALYDSQKLRTFNSYDIGFSTLEEFKDFYNGLYKRELGNPEGYDELVFSKNMTTTQIASENLKQHSLDKFVNLITGNFIELDKNKYDLIFCDALHDIEEIKINLPHLIERSRNNCIWAFHDMKQINIDEVLANSNSLLIGRFESLGVFLYLGKA